MRHFFRFLALVLASALILTACGRQGVPGQGGSAAHQASKLRRQDLTPFQSVAAGGSASCAVTTAGGVVCWGKPLGAPASDPTNVKLNPVPGLTGVKTVVMGLDHACALTDAGGVQCWGKNSDGQLGDGTTQARLVPAPVSGLSSGVESIAAGSATTCAVMTSHTVKCWGDDGTYGSLNKRTVPTDIPAAGSDAAQVIINNGLNCYLSTSGHVKCLYANGAVRNELDGISSLATSNTSGGVYCAVTTAGGAKCWGFTSNGGVGSGDTTYSSNEPANVVGLSSGVARIVVGYEYSCALLSSGAVKCWGLNQKGQLGAGNTTTTAVPVDVTGLSSGVSAIAAGGAHTCVVTAAGQAKCWGEGAGGKLGNGSDSDSSVPVDLAAALTSSDTTPPVSSVSLTPAPAPSGLYTAPVSLSVSAYDLGGSAVAEVRCVLNPVRVPDSFADLAPGCAYFTPQTISAAGAYAFYVASSDTSGNRETVQSVHFEIQSPDAPGASARALNSGAGSPCAVTTTGALRCWGSGPLGNGTRTYSTIPVDVSDLSGVKEVSSAPDHHRCALTTSGEVSCWGDNDFAQLGTFDSSGQATDWTGGLSDIWTGRTVPLKLDWLGSGVKSISAGHKYTCAVTSAGGVKCWGSPNAPLGAIFRNMYIPQLVDVPGLASGAAQVTAGTSHACALTTAGGVQCWGAGYDGQLGDGLVSSSTTPVAVTGLTGGVRAVAAGDSLTCALTTAGGVKCWGKGVSGKQSTPQDVPGLTSGVTAISVGQSSACALTTAGGVKCWGQNGNGELGNGTTTSSDTPTDVVGLTSGVQSISSSCAVLSTGTVKCWGNNAAGNLGNATTTSSLTPVDVSGFTATAPVSPLPVPTPAPAPSPDTMQLQASFTATGRSKATIRVEVLGAPAGASLDGEYRVATAPACGRSTLKTILYREFTSRSAVFTEQKRVELKPGSALLASVRVLDGSGKVIKNLYTQSCLN